MKSDEKMHYINMTINSCHMSYQLFIPARRR